MNCMYLRPLMNISPSCVNKDIVEEIGLKIGRARRKGRKEEDLKFRTRE